MQGISIILIIFTSLFFTGILIRTKSFFSGRKGPGVFQPLKDIWRLLKKGAVTSETTSFIFQIAPSIYFATVFLSALLVPFGDQPGLISFSGDFVFFAYLLALGKFFTIISALDTGSSFEGMGASREGLFSMLAEPAFFILIGSLSLLTGHTSFHQIFSTLYMGMGSHVEQAVVALAALVLVAIAMIENSRMPIDDPKTHLELTMMHEVIILDNSGFDLGMILYTTNLKFAMYGALIADLFLSPSIPIYLAIPFMLFIQVVFAISAGTIESFMARFRMSHNPQFIFVLTSISLLIFLGALLLLGKIT
ncbi:MAG: NADH-quinone oxidoreductase subunit H [bacterium]|nr:NADH-quinone oxidoreductase subunit H [bacterium]